MITVLKRVDLAESGLPEPGMVGREVYFSDGTQRKFAVKPPFDAEPSMVDFVLSQMEADALDDMNGTED